MNRFNSDGDTLVVKSTTTIASHTDAGAQTATTNVDRTPIRPAGYRRVAAPMSPHAAAVASYFQ